MSDSTTAELEPRGAPDVSAPLEIGLCEWYLRERRPTSPPAGLRPARRAASAQHYKLTEEKAVRFLADPSAVARMQTVAGYLLQSDARDKELYERVLTEATDRALHKLVRGVTFDPDHQDFQVWLYTFLRNCLLESFPEPKQRKRARALRIAVARRDREPDGGYRGERPEDDMARREVDEEFWRAVDAVLTPQQREVVLLRLAGFSVTETADQLGVSDANVSQLLKRAGERIHTELVRRGYF